MSAIPANLLTNLNHPNKRVRVEAATWAGNSGNKAIAPYLLPLLQDTWGPAAWEACQAIVKLKDISTIAKAYQSSQSIPQVSGLSFLKSLSGLTPWPTWPKGNGVIGLDEIDDQDQTTICETLQLALKSSEPEEQVVAMIGLKRLMQPEELQPLLKPLLRLRVNPFKYDENPFAFIDTLGFAIPQLGLPQSTISVSELAALYLIMAGDEESAKKIFKYALEEWWWYSSPKDLMIKCMFDQGWDWVIERLAAYQQDENINNKLASITCLKSIPSPSVQPILEVFAQDPKRKVRKEAERAIKAWQRSFSKES